MAFKYFNSLKWEISLWILVAAIVPLFIMSYQGYHCGRQAIIEAKELHLTSILNSRKAQLESLLGDIHANLEMISIALNSVAEREEPEGDKSSVTTYDSNIDLEFLRKHATFFKNIYLYDANWNLLTSVGDEECHHEAIVSFQSRSKPNMGNRFVISSCEDGSTEIHAIHPNIYSNENRARYIVAQLDLTHTIDPILRAPTGLGSKGKVLLFSEDGRYLGTPPLSSRTSSETIDKRSRPPFASANHENVSVTDRSGRVGENDAVISEYDDDRGEGVLGISAVVAGLNGRIVVEVSKMEAFAWLNKLRIRALTTGIITLILVFVLAQKTARRLSQPLRELAAISERIARGNHNERLGTLRGEEAQRVAVGFNKMLDELVASHHKLMKSTSLAAIGELSSSIVHEMRNPLSTIKMNVQVISEKIANDDAYSELGTIAIGQVARLERMLSDLLDYGKPLQMKMENIRLDILLNDVTEVVGKDMENKNIKVEITNDLGEQQITVDPEQLLRALTNLLTNAIQASHPDDTVLVASSIAKDDPQRIAISVIDNGPGVDESDKENVFKPFFTTREEGTGLGLANVKKIVEYHGGSVTVENRPEGGAIFTLLLPVQENRT